MNSHMKKCDRCDGNHYGIGGTTICTKCQDKSEKQSKIYCSRCERRCYDTQDDGFCYKCRYLEQQRLKNNPDSRRCTKCSHVIRSKNERITICSRKECLGMREYYRIVRDVKKPRVLVIATE